jgi:sulfur carrier protein
MEISVNDQKETISSHTALQQVLDARLGDRQKGVAVAVNDTVVPKAKWPGYILKPNDNVLIIKATQGG